jgi:iron(III) transport system substrate-binding protein
MHRHLLILAVIGACGLLAACGSSADDPVEASGPTAADVLAELEGLTGSAREERLLELVEAEGGELALYTSMSPSVHEEVIEAFEDLYGIDVALFRAGSEVVLQRVTEEAKAGFHGADVVESSGPELVLLDREGLLSEYQSPAAAGLSEGTPVGAVNGDRFNTYVVSWNTDLVPAGEEPRSWEELADPRWKGKVAIEVEDIDWYKTLWEYWVETEGRSPEEVDRLFEAIAANAVVVNGHTVMGELVAAGEFDVGVNYRHIVANLAAEGAPVAWEPPVEPVFRRPNALGVVQGAPHPAAALLFVDWLLGPGQEVLAAVNTDPTRADLVAGGEGIQQVVVDLEELVDEQEEWSERYERLLTLGTVIGD